MLGNFYGDTMFRFKEQQHRCLMGLSRYSWSRTVRRRQGREPGSTSVLMKDKNRPTVGQRAINSLIHSSIIFVGIFPGPKEERSYGQPTVTMAMSKQFTQVVGSLVSTGPMEDNRHRVRDSRSMGRKLAFTRGLSCGLLCWNRGILFSLVYLWRGKVSLCL